MAVETSEGVEILECDADGCDRWFLKEDALKGHQTKHTQYAVSEGGSDR